MAFGDGAAYNGDTGSSWRGAGPGRTLARNPNDPAAGLFGGPHDGVCQFAFADGNVKSIKNNTSATTLRRLSDRGDGETIQEDY
jgi:prepilin-type processing-associated H-X9-DG protein